MIPSYWLFGSKQRILQSGSVTADHYDLIEGTFPPAAETPLHKHANYSETIVVLEGEVSVYVPGQHVVLKAGETHFIPKNVPHTIANHSSIAPFKALAIAAPSGFAELILNLGIPSDGGDEPPKQEHDMQMVMEEMTRIGDTILGPPGARP